MSLKMFVFIK